MSSEFNFRKLEDIFQIKIDDKTLFEKAFTHSSHTKENSISSLNNYERLEFLGDSVLKLCASEILYKSFPQFMEGELTKIRGVLVSDNTLAKSAFGLGLDKFIILGKNEEKTGGRKKSSIMACVFEALLGAFYLDNKFDKIMKFLENVLSAEINEICKNIDKYDSQCILQEYTQSLTKTVPTYKIINESGLQHEKVFEVEVVYNGERLAVASGKTKKEAELNCAYSACIKLGIIKENE